MAQLKDLIVTGPSRFLNDLYALTIYEGGVKLEDKYYLASNPSGYISDLSTAINGLSVGSSPSQPGDYLVSQYAGASQTSYHRRPVYLVAQGVLGYTTSGKNYAIAMDSSTHKLYVNVPWTDTTYSAGSGISISTGRSISVTNPVPMGTVNDSVLLWDNDSGEPYWKAPITSTDNAIVRFDGTSGAVQNSAVKIDDNGVLIAKDNMYADSYSGALNMANSNIYGVNSIYFADASDSAQEAINFYRSSTTVDSIWASNGKLYFTPNRTLGAYGTTYEILHLGRSIPEAYLSWGGRNFSASYGPIDAAMIGTLGANRLELLRPGTSDNPGIEVFYSRDAGSTWIDYGLNSNQKRNIFNSTAGTSVIIGKRASSDTKSVDDRAKIVIHTGTASVYTSLNKFALYVSTAGSGNCWVTIDKCIQNKDYSVESNWVNVVTKVPISGWSGWNIINTSNIPTYGTSPASQYGHLRFIFGADTAGGTTYSGLGCSIIMGFGGVGWTIPSYLAKYNHAYIWDAEGTATFQAGVTARGNVTADVHNGTATSLSTSYLIAGNSIASGTANNTRGFLRLYGEGSGYMQLAYNTTSSTNTTYYLYAQSTAQAFATINNSGVTSGTLAKFDSTGGHLVSLTNGSNGQILTIINGALTWSGNINTLLPSYSSSDLGKFLVVSEGDGSPAWETLYWSDISSTPTTLSGYGITDAKIQNGTITLGSNSITPVTGSSLTANDFIVGNGGSAIKTATVATIRTKLGLKQLAFVEASTGNVGKYLKAVEDGDAVDYEWSTPPTGMSNPMTAANDIIVGGTNGAATKLAKGSNGTFLGINSSGNVAWVDNPVPFNGDNDNEVLMWDGTDEKAFWCAPLWMENLIFNAGEIIIGNSSGNPIALSNGSTGQVLTTISSGDRVAWRNATVRMNANTGSTALSVLLAPSDVSNGASKEAQYANTSGKQLKFTPSTGNLSGVAQINGSTVPSSPKFTDTLADYITEWDNEYSDEPTGIVKYAYDHTPALYLDSITYSDMVHSWSTSSNIAMLTMTNTYSGSTNPILTLTSSPVQNTGTIFKLTNNTTQTSNNWLSALDIMAPNMASSSNMNYANFTIFNCGKAASNNNRGSLVYHHTADGSVYNCLTMGFYGNDHVFRVYAYGGAWIYGSLYVENGNKVATETWVESNFVRTCLIKGTKILMADGTEKNIEDVERGDEVKSIDINSGKMITAMVVSCEKTGVNHEYTTHLFDNGSYIVTYGQHSVYNKTLGHPIDISKFRIGDETYDAEGNVITYAGNMRYYDRSTDVAHYDINTSNNLYFANGILNGKNVFAKYRYMRRENMDIPDSILAVLNRQETANKPAIGYETDSNYFRAIAAKLKEKSVIAKRIEEAKQKLADSDYLVAKFTEGLISAVDWLKAKAERGNWRTAINNDEPLLEAADNAIKAIKAKYQTDDSSVKDRFELFSAWDNAALEYYREWLTKEKSIDIPGPLTEEERHGSYANQDLT